MYPVTTPRTKCGIWMDHAEAQVLDVRDQTMPVTVIENEHESRERFAGEGSDGSILGVHRSMNTEGTKNARKSEHLHEFYHRLASSIHSYDEIYVFGPTTAPQEFVNYLHEQKEFAQKHISVESSDYITGPQILERVRKHYHQPL